MPRPKTPAKVDGIALGADATAYLDRLIGMLYGVDTLRPEAPILKQALGSFRLAWQIMDGAWAPRVTIQIGQSPYSLVIPNPAATL